MYFYIFFNFILFYVFKVLIFNYIIYLLRKQVFLKAKQKKINLNLNKNNCENIIFLKEKKIFKDNIND